MLLTRCGIDAKNYYSAEISITSTILIHPRPSLSWAAGSDISEMILREIAATVKSLQQEEKKQVRTFAAHEHNRYDVNVKSKNERSFDHGTDLQAGGRLSSSEPDNAGIPEGWEVWNAAAKFPTQPAEWNLHRNDAQRQAEQSLRGDRPEIKRDDGFLTTQMAKSEGVTERLKASDQMRWVAMMNSIRSLAEEAVLTDLIYS